MLVPSVDAAVIHAASGLSPEGVEVRFEAELTISGDVLTIRLVNDSPEASLNPADLLSSYYFDISNEVGLRPSLTYVSAVGDVYLADDEGPDVLIGTDLDIRALVKDDDSWAFKTMDPTKSPGLGFGLGTVGNSDLSPNNFKGNIVDGIDYSIYNGDITTRNLRGRELVANMATFVFTGVAGFTEGDISSAFAFGLGTSPDGLLVPEPGSLVLLALGALGLFRARRYATTRK